MRIGFTGTREGMTSSQQLALTALLLDVVRKEPISFHHGDCVGADEQAHAVVRSLACRVRPTIIVDPPLENRLRAYCEGDSTKSPRNYLDRNRDIVDDSDILLAAPRGPEEQRSGTWSTVRYARRRGKRVYVINVMGEVE